MGSTPYSLLRKILFKLDAEKAHNFSLKALNILHKLNFSVLLFGKKRLLPTKVMGIEFPNPVGLAAGSLL